MVSKLFIFLWRFATAQGAASGSYSGAALACAGVLVARQCISRPQVTLVYLSIFLLIQPENVFFSYEKRFKEAVPGVPTKSGVMVGLGETDDEILQVMRDLRAHGVDMLTVGQYLAPSGHHLPVARYVHPDTFAMFEREAQAMGFTHAAVGAMVRSSYHADQQAHAAGLADALA